MNQALAEYEAAAGYVKPADVETAMQILANAGYNSRNWQCLTSGYEVYWDSKENKMVLYNSSTAEIEYPEEYIGTKDITENATNGRWQIYNGNYEAAFKYDFSFSSSSSDGKLNGTSLASVATDANSGAATLSAALSGNSADIIKSSIGLDGDNVFINASKTEYSAGYNVSNSAASSYAKIDSYFVSNSKEVVLDNNGSLKANTYVISVVADKNGVISSDAKQAAGEFVYALFVQMNAGAANSNASILVPEGTTIDVSKHEWKAADIFTGYFGATDIDNDGTVTPIVIDGARLTTATGHALTYKLDGSASKYCCTGFFGAVYGTTTIENVVFKNLSISEPGWDFVVATNKNNRNCVALIGAIIPDPSRRSDPVNVTIKNVTVENTSIKGIGSVGGIVGYIGAEQSYENLKGNVTLENCSFEGDVQSTDSFYATSPGSYSPVGGIVGFTCRCDSDNLNILIKDCTFKGSAKGYGGVGGIIGNHKNGKLVIENCASIGTLEIAGSCTNTEEYTKDDANYGTYKKGDKKYYGKVVGAIGVLIGSRSESTALFRVDSNTLSKSNISGSTVAIGSKPAADTGIEYAGITHFVGAGDTYLTENNLNNEYVFFNINAKSVTTSEKSFVSYLAQSATTHDYSRSSSFSFTQYSAATSYADIDDKLISLPSSSYNTKGGASYVDSNGASDTNGNQYNVTIAVTKASKAETSGDNAGKFKYTYTLSFTKVGGTAVSLVSKKNGNAAGYTAGAQYCYEADVLIKANYNNTDHYTYKDNVAAQISPYAVVSYTVKANY